MTTRAYAALYEHPHGTDVRIFVNEDDAWAWRTQLAKEWWEDEFADEPPSDDAIGPAYFDRMAEHDEFFSVHPCGIEGLPDQPAATDAAVSDPETEALMMQYGGLWGEHPQYPSTDWRTAVANDETRGSYWSWVVAQLED